jgi:hypothetical protein
VCKGQGFDIGSRSLVACYDGSFVEFGKVPGEPGEHGAGFEAVEDDFGLFLFLFFRGEFYLAKHFAYRGAGPTSLGSLRTERRDKRADCAATKGCEDQREPPGRSAAHDVTVTLPEGARGSLRCGKAKRCSVSVPSEPGRQRKTTINDQWSTARPGVRSRTQSLVAESTADNFTIFEGTLEIQRMIVGRALTGPDVR